MSPDVVVVMAYRDMGCEHRRRAFAFTHSWYGDWWCCWPAPPTAIVVEGGADDATFTRASALNAAIRRTDAKIIIQSDPDSLVADPAMLTEAVRLAGVRDGLVVPHDQYLYLSEAATARVYAACSLLHTDEGSPPWAADPLEGLGPGDCDEHGSGGRGNVTVFSRATWERCGGYDERFPLWGGDDTAFAYASEAFVAPIRRLPGGVIHLWHPRRPESDPENPGYAEQFEIVAEYRDAAAIGPAAVRKLVMER